MNKIKMDALRTEHANLLRVSKSAVGCELKHINARLAEIERDIDQVIP